MKMTIDTQNPQSQSGQTIIINRTENRSNGLETSGFVLSIIAIFLGWVPVVGWIIWLLGLIFSFIGVFKQPKGLAIAGLAISLMGIILLLTVFGAILGSTALFL